MLTLFLDYIFYLEKGLKRKGWENQEEMTPPYIFRLQAVQAIAKSQNWPEVHEDYMHDLAFLDIKAVNVDLLLEQLKKSSLFNNEVHLSGFQEIEGIVVGLLEWRKAIYNYNHHFDGWLAAPKGFQVAFSGYHHQKSDMFARLTEIDRLLSIIFSYKPITVEELIAEFDYPKGDLFDIDIDWM